MNGWMDATYRFSFFGVEYVPSFGRRLLRHISTSSIPRPPERLLPLSAIHDEALPFRPQLQEGVVVFYLGPTLFWLGFVGKDLLDISLIQILGFYSPGNSSILV